MKRNIITIIIALVAMTAGAQEKVTLQGSIQDSFLERGLHTGLVLGARPV